ncbi:Hpt domain-containing protein [Cupriavidus agavae]|uniref:HPt (Histidine-containing phosphotransfer) domain-containing protein n=1 Tax=Cupriavidus agavae TaxID=1001822 RepID=A0A4Q7RH28_9BURK|nr:Hpt domain-containing protein [Cupriavidus agavae]RZT31927.1 HPt (histidine-containing phosphotransfer) domain-containing protein [Cupriavidus agavae]
MKPAGVRHRLPPDELSAIGAALAEASRHDAALQSMLVARLLETNATDLADLRFAVARRDWPGVRRTVHRIKGAAALAGCTSLVAAGKSIESAAGQGNGAVVNTLLPRYIAILDAFNDTLSAVEASAILPMQTVQRTGTLASGAGSAPNSIRRRP